MFHFDFIALTHAHDSPIFDKVSIALPSNSTNDKKKTLTITAEGALTKQYVKSLTVNGQSIDFPVITHKQISNGGEIVFEMSDTIEKWGNGVLNVRAAFNWLSRQIF